MSISPGKLHKSIAVKSAIAFCFLIALLPVVGATMPPIMDLPNHLARIWLLAGGASKPPLSEIYEITLAKAGGNFFVDLAAAGLAHALPIFVVSKVLVALMVLGPPLGGLALNRILARGAHPYQLAFLSLAWSTTAIAGFINFQISLFAALLCGAAYAANLRALGRSSKFVFNAMSSAILLCVHPLGIALYMMTVVGLEIGPDFASKLTRGKIVAFAIGLVELVGAAALPVLARSVLLLRVSDRHDAFAHGPIWGVVGNIIDPLRIFTIWFSPVLSYDLSADLLTFLPVAGLILFALIYGYVKAHAGLALVSGSLWLLSPLSPDAFGEGTWLAQRFPIMAALLFLAAVTPTAEVSTAPRAWPLAALTLLVVARTLWISWVWMSRQSDIASLQQAIRTIEAGSSLMTLQQEASDWRQAPVGRFMIANLPATGRHLGGLAVIWRSAFVPTLFSMPGQHPLEIKPAWRENRRLPRRSPIR